MKLSTRSTYSMRALVELGLTAGRGPLSAAVIAKQQDLSVAYLEQLLHRLKKQGLVLSVRGPKGGYLLAREPEGITVAEIVRVLEGNGEAPNGHGKDGHLAAPISEIRRSGPGPAPAGAKGGPGRQAGRHAQQIAHAVFRRVHERLARSLDEVTLKDLCDEVRELAGEPLDHRYVFHI